MNMTLDALRSAVKRAMLTSSNPGYKDVADIFAMQSPSPENVHRRQLAPTQIA
ncbi:hypothetical protein PGT21_036419 [Puccinia graminis f. sp. tritici]|uniref:Uncharacterized protein n=1 Tax=Puccinia graminis f. sp. tritici TaxID=56615 RepID=A0A5B0PKN1_PUCGR|nr:hypothetical protein PGT21_036689 [Puccinia graminis f. sp. tritici]KAA1100432.1 hypothetical protein PGTUg99_028182 [Puccinia graminis f. sp. tritici]KAA1102157.1 hypothetical protein PGT21_036419 [Puccinia graminis f. sp. tritici]